MSSTGLVPEGQGDAQAQAPPRPNLAARAVGSGAWSLVGQIFQVILGVISFALLTRWLSPSDYGVLGMASTVTGFLGVVGDSGMTNAVMRLPEIDGTAEATAFWLSLLGGAALMVVSGVSAPLLALFYKNGSITWVAVALSVTFILAVPMRVPTARLSRAMRFRELTVINMTSSTAAVAIAVVLAIRGFGVWALVAQTVATYILQGLLTLAACPTKMSPRLWSRTRARDLASVGSRLSGFSLSVAIGRALDSVLAGRFLGSAALGFMGMGMKLVHLPVERLSGAMYSVFLPATVELADDERQGRAFVSTARLGLIIVAPFAFGTLAISPEIVAMLPPRWLGLAPVLRVYALTTLVTPIGYLAMSVLVAHGRASALLRSAIALIPVSWVSAVLGAMSRSVVGMVAAWSFSVVTGTVVFVCLIWRRLALGAPFLRAILTPVLVSAAMAVLVRLVLSALALSGTRVGFMVGSVAGLVIYGVLAYFTMRADVVRVLGLLGQSIQRRAGKVER
jgi:PST family polysaccharide transporter